MELSHRWADCTQSGLVQPGSATSQWTDWDWTQTNECQFEDRDTVQRRFTGAPVKTMRRCQASTGEFGRRISLCDVRNYFVQTRSDKPRLYWWVWFWLCPVWKSGKRKDLNVWGSIVIFYLFSEENKCNNISCLDQEVNSHIHLPAGTKTRCWLSPLQVKSSIRPDKPELAG